MRHDRCCARCANWKAVMENCPYFGCGDDGLHYWGRGECRAEPPKAGRGEFGQTIARWPVTRAADWCATFKAREESDDGQRNS